MIEFLWRSLVETLGELWHFLSSTFDPVRDTLDIALVTIAVYWLLLMIKGTRAVQMLVGLLAILVARLVADLFELATVGLILDAFLAWSPLIVVILFQNDIRRALARVGRSVFPRIAERQESQILEEIVRAAQTLAQKRVGALLAIERETGLEDLIEAGIALDAAVSKELLTSIFLPYSPLHDGAVVVQGGRVTHAGCILPLTLRTDLPEGVGTRHRAAVGITEETDAVVIVVSEETAGISVVMGGEMLRELDAPRLRELLRDVFVRGKRRLGDAPPEQASEAEAAEPTAAEEADEARRGLAPVVVEERREPRPAQNEPPRGSAAL